MTNPERFEPRIKPKEEIPQWEQLRQSGEQSFISQYAEKYGVPTIEVSEKLKKNTLKLLEEEVANNKRIDYAKHYYERELKPKLRARGVVVEGISPEKEVDLAKKAALKDLEISEDPFAKATRGEIKDIYDQMSNFKRKTPEPETPGVILNILTKRAQELGSELNTAAKENDVKKVSALKSKLKEFAEIQQGLTESIYGKTLEQVTVDRIEGMTETERNERYAKAMREGGYSVRERGKIRKKFDVFTSDKRLKEFKTEAEANSFLGSMVKKDVVAKEMPEIIKDTARTPEGAIGGIRAVYDRVKGVEVTEFLKSLGEGKKVTEAEKEFTGAGADAHWFWGEVDNKTGELDGLPGMTWETALPRMKSFFERWGFAEASVSDTIFKDKMDKFDDQMKKEKKGFAKAVQTETGWIGYWLDLVKYLLSGTA